MQRREISRTDTEIGVNSDGTVYRTDSTVTVTDDSQEGVHITARETYIDRDGYSASREVSMSEDDFVELAKAEAEDSARAVLRSLTSPSEDYDGYDWEDEDDYGYEDDDD